MVSSRFYDESLCRILHCRPASIVHSALPPRNSPFAIPFCARIVAEDPIVNNFQLSRCLLLHFTKYFLAQTYFLLAFVFFPFFFFFFQVSTQWRTSQLVPCLCFQKRSMKHFENNSLQSVLTELMNRACIGQRNECKPDIFNYTSLSMIHSRGRGGGEYFTAFCHVTAQRQ